MAATNSNSVHVVNLMALSNLPQEEVEAHRGEFALMHNGVVESYHETKREALKAASAKYRRGQFSVQRVEPQPIDMGFTDCAAYPGKDR